MKGRDYPDVVVSSNLNRTHSGVITDIVEMLAYSCDKRLMENEF